MEGKVDEAERKRKEEVSDTLIAISVVSKQLARRFRAVGPRKRKHGRKADGQGNH